MDSLGHWCRQPWTCLWIALDTSADNFGHMCGPPRQPCTGLQTALGMHKGGRVKGCKGRIRISNQIKKRKGVKLVFLFVLFICKKKLLALIS